MHSANQCATSGYLETYLSETKREPMHISDIIPFNRLQFTDIKEMETDLNFMFSSKEKVMRLSAVSGEKKNLSY